MNKPRCRVSHRQEGGRKGPALWDAGTSLHSNETGCAVVVKHHHWGRSCPVGNSVLHSYSLEFVHSQANVTTNILTKRKNIYSVFCILQTALPLSYLSLCGTMLQCSLYSGHPVRNKEKSSLKMWFGLQERSKLTNISKKPLYERFIVCLFLKACQDVFPTGETVLFPFTT